MYCIILRILLLYLGISHGSLAMADADIVHDGRADLSQWNSDAQKIISLQGQWEFYWSQLLTPEDFKKQNPKDRSLIQVPGSWNNAADFPVNGFATYRLQISLSDIREIGIYFPTISSSSRVYIDEKLVIETGRVGTVKDKRFYLPSPRDSYLVFTPSKKDFEIVIQVANFELFLAGIASPVKIGTQEAVSRDKEITTVIGAFLIGSLFIMGIYHLCLFALRTKVKSTLYFGLLLIACSVHLLANRGSGIYLFIPDLSYNAALRIYSSWVLMVPCFVYFTKELFPNYFSRKFMKLASFCWPIYGLALFTEPGFFLPLIILAEVALVLIIIYTSYVLTQAIRAGEDGARLSASGSAILVIFGIHDLFQGMVWIQSVPLFSGGLFLFIFFQSILLARRFSNAFVHVEKSEREISQLSDDLRVERDQVLHLNQNLELKVEEKTRDIRSIMTHIPLGIFAITAEQHKIHKDYSEHLRELLEVKDLAGLDACPLLFDASQLSSDEKSQAISVFDACLGENILMFEMNAHSLPRELRRRRIAGDERIIELTWNPITTSGGCIEKILVTLRDVTELRALEEDAQDKKEELQFIGELINVRGDTFQRFINSCRDFIAENRKLLHSKSIEHADMDVLKVLFINMHTMKGAARSLYFKKMTRIFHDVEQYYANLQKDPQLKWDIARMNRDMDEVEAIVAVYNDINKLKLGRHTDEEKDIELPESQVLLLYQNLLTVSMRIKHVPDGKTQALLGDMRSWIFPKIYTSAREAIDDSCLCLAILAKDLEKAQPRISLSAPHLFLNRRGEDLLRKILVHILRNTMDHGIERPAERVALGKDPQGLITIKMAKIPGGVEMRFSDDGRGLNLNKLRVLGEARGLLAPGQEVTIEDAAELIFSPGISTASKISDVSGRGVGMEAVRIFLLQDDGHIKIHLLSPTIASPDCHPFIFVIYFPDFLFAATGEDIVPAAA